jgi:hypothetical protein
VSLVILAMLLLWFEVLLIVEALLVLGKSSAARRRSRGVAKCLIDFKEFMGVSIKNPQRRDANMVALENVISIAYRKSPTSRMAWRPLFANVFTLLVDYYDINASRSELLTRKLESALPSPCLDIDPNKRGVKRVPPAQPEVPIVLASFSAAQRLALLAVGGGDIVKEFKVNVRRVLHLGVWIDAYRQGKTGAIPLQVHVAFFFQKKWKKGNTKRNPTNKSMIK